VEVSSGWINELRIGIDIARAGQPPSTAL